MVVRRVALRAA
jgi:hypothetical protein